MPGVQQKKYFDKVIEVDFNPLLTEGIITPFGDRIKVQIFGHVRCMCVYVYEPDPHLFAFSFLYRLSI